MGRIIKSRLFYFILGAITFSGITVFAYSIAANEISFIPENINWKVTNVEEALNMLYSNADGFNPDSIEKLWEPVGFYQDTFSGTYQFLENYKWVLVIYYTNSSVNTVYQVDNMELYKDMGLAQRYHEAASFYIYKDVGIDASIYFSINNLAMASITVYGIK